MISKQQLTTSTSNSRQHKNRAAKHRAAAIWAVFTFGLLLTGCVSTPNPVQQAADKLYKSMLNTFVIS